ncbi:unnamed protein product, partial [Heterosigma akashiwo]
AKLAIVASLARAQQTSSASTSEGSTWPWSSHSPSWKIMAGMFDKLFCCTQCADDDADETGMDLMTAEKAEETRQRFLETISAHKIPYEGITVTNLEVREVPE